MNTVLLEFLITKGQFSKEILKAFQVHLYKELFSILVMYSVVIHTEKLGECFHIQMSDYGHLYCHHFYLNSFHF
jgi:hypothetical protein